MTVTPATGYGNASVTVTPAALEAGAASRTATITVTTADNAVSQTVTLTQNAPEPTGPAGNYVDLAATPVLFCSNNQAWNMENNPDYASSGNTGAVSGLGSGYLKSYSHFDNTSVYMQFEAAATGHESKAAVFIMAAEGNITAKQLWTEDAFVFHLPVWKIAAGQSLCADFGLYCKGDTTPKYYAFEASFDGGATWKKFNTGVTDASPNNGGESNLVLSKTPDHVNFPHLAIAVTENIENAEVLVRLRVVDATCSVNGSTSRTSPGAGAVRLLGGDQTTLAGSADAVMGPKFYIE